jgi:hypothetical protein
VVFYYAATILDAWLAVVRALAGPKRAWRSLRHVWRALPGDLMGLAVMRGCGIRAPSRVVDAGGVSAIVVEHPNVGRYFEMQMMPVQAQTLGRYVFARCPVPEHTLEHEIEHIRQWQRFGPLYLPLYFGSSALALLRGRRPYWDNRFESAARRRADRAPSASADGGMAVREGRRVLGPHERSRRERVLLSVTRASETKPDQSGRI